MYESECEQVCVNTKIYELLVQLASQPATSQPVNKYIYAITEQAGAQAAGDDRSRLFCYSISTGQH